VANEFDLIGVFSGPDYYFQYPNGDEVYTVIHLYVAKNVRGTLEMKDDESLKLTYFSKNELPDHLEKRTKLLLSNLEDKLWDLGSSFANYAL